MKEPHDDQLAPIDGVLPPPPPEGASPVPEATEEGSDSAVAPPSLPPGGQPAAFPDTDAIAAAAEIQRAMLGQPAGNVIEGAPHFLRNVDGEEVCGNCGNPWECQGYQSLRVRDAIASTSEHGSDQLPGLIGTPPTMQEAAEAAGIDVREFEARLAQMRSRR